MIVFRHLRYFVAVVDAGSISRAAQLIPISQPSLSQQITALELEVGVGLLKRSARGVHPTPEGQLLYQEATTLIRRVDALADLLQHAAGPPTGTVVLGLSSTLGATFAAEILAECAAALPHVRIRLTSSDSEQIASLVATRAVDLAFIFEDVPIPHLDRRVLYRQRLFFFGRDAAALESAQRAGLAAGDLVLPAPPNVTRSAIDRAASDQHVDLSSDMEASTFGDVLAGVRAGGIALLPKGDLDESTPDLAPPVPIEPPIWLTAALVFSDEFPLSRPAQAVSHVLTKTVDARIEAGGLRGVQRGRIAR